MSLVTQFEDLSPLGGQISTGVWRAQSLVGDLQECHTFSQTLMELNTKLCFSSIFFECPYLSNRTKVSKNKNPSQPLPASDHQTWTGVHLHILKVLLFQLHQGFIIWSQVSVSNERQSSERARLVITVEWGDPRGAGQSWGIHSYTWHAP